MEAKPWTSAILIYRGTAFGTERDRRHKRYLVLGAPACLAASQFSAKVSVIRPGHYHAAHTWHPVRPLPASASAESAKPMG